MFIIDYEATAAIAGPDGARHACSLSGLVEPDHPGVAGLGHSPTALADQSWRELTLSVASALDFQAGHVIFADGSRRAVELSLRSSDGGAYVYALTLGAP